MDAVTESLTYEAHSISMVEALGDLFRRNSLVDCILAAEGQCLKAHKVVLAANSSYFQMLFTQEIDKYPIVFLKDIEYQYLKLVIDYIYLGQIEIRSSQLDMFLEVAQSLKIRGLVAMRREKVSERSKFFNPPCEDLSVKEADSLSEVIQGIKVEKEGISACTCIEDVTEMGNCIEDLGFLPQQTEYCSGTSETIDESATSIVHSQLSLIPSSIPVPEIGITRDTESQQSYLFSGDDLSLIDYSSRIQMENYSEVFEETDIKIEETISCDNFMEEENDIFAAVTKTYSCYQNSSNEDSSREKKARSSRQSATRGQVKSQRRSAASESFSGASNVLQHPRSKRHYCPHCNKAFARSSNLRAHVYIHTGDGPPKRHRCSHCSKAFTSPSHLSNHVRIHTGDRPFKCQECSKAFSKRDSLWRHQFTHSGKWPYQCELCRSGFAQRTKLEEHKLIHSGEKPNQCPLCEKAFTTKSNLYVHVRKVHDISLLK